MTGPRPRPVLENVDQDIFWSHAARRELVYQVCADCAHVVFYPRRHCTRCAGSTLDVRASAGRGVVFASTVIRAHPDPYFAARTPYLVGLIDLEEGFRFLCEIVADPTEVAVGTRVRLDWEDAEGLFVPLFRPEA